MTTQAPTETAGSSLFRFIRLFPLIFPLFDCLLVFWLVVCGLVANDSLFIKPYSFSEYTHLQTINLSLKCVSQNRDTLVNTHQTILPVIVITASGMYQNYHSWIVLCLLGWCTCCVECSTHIYSVGKSTICVQKSTKQKKVVLRLVSSLGNNKHSFKD